MMIKAMPYLLNISQIFKCSGYMSPEYALDGHFSVKSDVFSFGVVVLEIISGKRNTGFYQPEHELSLLGYVRACLTLFSVFQFKNYFS